MLKYYRVSITFYNKGEVVGYKNLKNVIKEESEVVLKTIQIITWDNLEEEYKKIGLLAPFNYWNFKKGKRISFFSCSPFNKVLWDIKEWKEKLKIQYEIKYTECKEYSINDIIKYKDFDIATRFLRERDIKVVIE